MISIYNPETGKVEATAPEFIRGVGDIRNAEELLKEHLETFERSL